MTIPSVVIVLAFTVALVLGVLIVFQKINAEGRSTLRMNVALKLGPLKFVEVKITIRPF
jgi:hypothetical protein